MNITESLTKILFFGQKKTPVSLAICTAPQKLDLKI